MLHKEIDFKIGYEEFSKLIQHRYGIVLDDEKTALVKTRLTALIEESSTDSIKDYLELIKSNPLELKKCVEALTTHKTHWFREISHFQWLKKELQTVVKAGESIKIWSAACSTGQEVYSLAFLCYKEGLSPSRIKILGTDLSQRAVRQSKELPKTPEFHKEVEKLRLRINGRPDFDDSMAALIGNSIKFREFNLISSDLPSEVQFDVIFIRNVLIYFEKETIETVCQRLVRYLKPGGYVVLGVSESIQGKLSELVHIGNSIYRYQPSGRKIDSQQKQLTRVLIVEDSSTLRKILKSIYSQIPNVEVVGEATSVAEALSAARSLRPNFISLDLMLPDGTGVDFLKSLKDISEFKIEQCVLVTECSPTQGSLVLDALELGGTTYLQKPSSQDIGGFTKNIEELISGLFETERNGIKEFQARVSAKRPSVELDQFDVIVIGSSTGGTEVVKSIVGGLPADCPPIVIVQHMPVEFTGVFAERIEKETGRPTQEVLDKVDLVRGHAYLGTGGRHLSVENKGGKLRVFSKEGELINRFMPSVSKLFSSIETADIASRSIAIMLTGMGRDGAQEMLQLKQKGALTIGQSAESCAVYGMPRAASELGALSWSGSPLEIIQLLCGGAPSIQSKK